jgi:ribonuclease HI/probable phosphoglycerate mutase
VSPEPAGADRPPAVSPESEYLLYCDGAARGNPGPASTGYVLVDTEGHEIVARGERLGVRTNNVAEYTALLQGLDAALELGIQRLRVRMDSELVVRQLLGIYRVRNPGLQPLFAAVQERRRRFAAFAIEHVPRRDNSRADALANAALDGLLSHES